MQAYFSEKVSKIRISRTWQEFPSGTQVGRDRWGTIEFRYADFATVGVFVGNSLFVERIGSLKELALFVVLKVGRGVTIDTAKKSDHNIILQLGGRKTPQYLKWVGA